MNALLRSKSIASQIIRSVLLTLTKIHEKEVIHRNICPSNILVTLDQKTHKIETLLVNFSLGTLEGFQIEKT